MHERFRPAFAAILAFAVASPAGAGRDQPVPGGMMAPREAGARYGQAMGVALVCYGLRTTAAVDRLPLPYAGADRTAFQAEADKVLTAWREASSCRTAGGPNPCRLAHEWSCRDAVREIGPEGTKVPGLVEARN